MNNRENVWDIVIEPKPHPIAWWVVRPLVAILLLSIVGIPVGILIGAAAVKPWKEHKAWKESEQESLRDQ